MTRRSRRWTSPGVLRVLGASIVVVAFVAITQRDLVEVLLIALLFGLLVLGAWWNSDEPTEPSEAVRGTVRVWHGDLGWGAIGSTEVPSETWVHSSVIEGSGFRSLHVGDEVEFLYMRGRQEGYAYLATWVRPLKGSGRLGGSE